MINLRTVIIPSKAREDGMLTVYFQFTKHRRTAWINTGVRVAPDNFENGLVMGGEYRDPNARSKNIQIGLLKNKYEQIILDRSEFFRHLSVNDIKAILLDDNYGKADEYFTFAVNYIKELKTEGKTASIHLHEYSVMCIRKYWREPILPFTTITKEFLSGLHSYLLGIGLELNSVAIVERYIRIVYNVAADRYNKDPLHPVIPLSPFGRNKYRIQKRETEHRALDIGTIRTIIAYQPEKQIQQRAKDIWLLQLMLLGINTKDLFYLKKTDVKSGRIKINRSKTGKRYNIKIEPEAWQIIDRYRGNKYLLMFGEMNRTESARKTLGKHRRSSLDQYADQDAFGRMVNRGMQKIQDELKINPDRKITTYFTRHSFATIWASDDLRIEDDTISIAMTHKSPDKSLQLLGVYRDVDWSRVDKANRKFIDYLFVQNEPDFCI